ncbi:MAG: helix-turn-helix domain-containing protein [Pseudomonadota bacterium]
MTLPISRYRPRAIIAQMAQGFSMSIPDFLAAVGMPPTIAASDNPSMTTEQFFQMWERADAMLPDGFTVDIARNSLASSFSPQLFAFSCSPDVETGLRRLAVFKPLVGPFKLDFETGDTFDIIISSPDPAHDLPTCMFGLEIVHILELIRTTSRHHVIPVALSVPADNGRLGPVEIYAQRPIARTGPLRIRLSLEDAARPLVSADDGQWDLFEPHLRRQMAELMRDQSCAARVRQALLELMPAGLASVEAVCGRLATSKRSLQRRLKEEGTSFQAVLDATRRELALHYLRDDDLRVEEVSHLLAFRDPNSFYRAFQGWTGMTPRQARLLTG